jgi:hypothetical protein
MTDDDRRTATVAIRTARLADAMLNHAHVLTPDPVEQAGTLLTAAFVLIERNVGKEMAAEYLTAMIKPQLADWRGTPRHDLVP